MFVLHNALIVPEYMFQMNYKNRAFQYGDGFFETMIYDGDKVRFYEDHFQRITSAIEVFNFSTPDKFTKDTLYKNLVNLVEKNALTSGARIKLMIYRSEGGFFAPEYNDFELLVTAVPRNIDVETVKQKVDFYDEYPVQKTPVSAFKTMSALPYVFAGMFAKRHNLDDVVLLNENGFIAECLYTNIYWIKDNELYTPSVNTGCVSGVMRKQILTSANACSINVHEGEFTQEDLIEADFVFNSNVTGFFILNHVQPKTYKTDHPVFETLKEDVFNGY